jgi:lysophospholipase L1-like esterase
MRSSRPKLAWAIAALIGAGSLASSAWSQTSGDPPLSVEAPCPPPPQALVKRWTAVGEFPVHSAEELAAYQRYVEVLKANDWAYLCRYADDNRAMATGARPRVVLIGDSITEFWKTRDPDRFATGVIDRGIGGQTSPQMLLRFQQDVIALRPRVVHIMAGTNDIAGNTGPTPEARFRGNIEAMVTLAQAHGIKVILASIPPAKAFYWRPEAGRAQRIPQWNAWLRAYAQERGVTFVDYYTALVDAEGGLRAEFGADVVHPSKAGYRIMDPLFDKALAEAEAQR